MQGLLSAKSDTVGAGKDDLTKGMGVIDILALRAGRCVLSV